MRNLFYLLISLLLLFSCSKEEVNHDIIIAESKGGSVIGQSGIVNDKALMLFIANPKTLEHIDYKFSHWIINGIVTYGNPTTVIVKMDTTIKPIFIKKRIDDDEIYGNVIEDNFKSYLRGFILDANRYGINLSNVQVDESIFEIVTNIDYIAASVGYNSPSFTKILINIDEWNRLSKEEKVMVMWHEFGHDVLGLDHLCKGGEIMSGQHQDCKGDSGVDEYFDIYEMSYNNSNLKRNFQRGVFDMFNGNDQIFFDSRNTFTSKGDLQPIFD